MTAGAAGSQPPAKESAGPRIGVACPGEAHHEASWSGVPRGIGSGLRAAGAREVHLNAEPPRRLRGAAARAVARLRGTTRGAAMVGPELAALRSATVRWRLGRARPLDGVVQLGTTFLLPRGVHAATLEDATVVQALRMEEPYACQASEPAREAWIARQREAYRRAAACCVASHWAAESVTRDYGVPPAKVHVVGFGRNREPRAAERDWSRPRFLFVANYWERKNGAAVVEALARLREEVPEATLDVVGRHPPIDVDGVTGHGPLRIGVAAERETLDRLFETATCYVMPSRFEAFGIAYVEAAAAGVPSIGTTAGGAADAIGDGGRLVDPGDTAGLLAAMRELADGRVAAALGARARERAVLFTWQAVAERVVRALGLSVAGGRQPASFL